MRLRDTRDCDLWLQSESDFEGRRPGKLDGCVLPKGLLEVVSVQMVPWTQFDDDLVRSLIGKSEVNSRRMKLYSAEVGKCRYEEVVAALAGDRQCRFVDYYTMVFAGQREWSLIER
jgi:hypothetical protein